MDKHVPASSDVMILRENVSQLEGSPRACEADTGGEYEANEGSKTCRRYASVQNFFIYCDSNQGGGVGRISRLISRSVISAEAASIGAE